MQSRVDNSRPSTAGYSRRTPAPVPMVPRFSEDNTSDSAAGSARDCEIDSLLDQVYELKQALIQAENQRARLEMEVREECVTDMEAQVK